MGLSPSKQGLSRMEREIAYNHEMDYLKNNKSCLWIHLSETLSKMEILTCIEKFILHINSSMD